MKVLNFLEMFKQTMNDPDIVKDGHIETYEYLLSIFNIDSELYSQPFKPEMITELFEGWSQDGSYYASPLHIDNINYENKVYYLRFHWDKYSIVYKTKNDQHSIYVGNNKIPRTLDDFINDCQRAGIKLERKTNNGTEPKE